MVPGTLEYSTRVLNFESDGIERDWRDMGPVGYKTECGLYGETVLLEIPGSTMTYVKTNNQFFWGRPVAGDVLKKD